MANDGRVLKDIRCKVIDLEHRKMVKLEWLWPNRVPAGKITLLIGNAGVGKSLWSIDFAARLSSGRGWPDYPGVPCKKGSVAFITSEDDIDDTIIVRLRAAGADMKKVKIIQELESIWNKGNPGAMPFDLNAGLVGLTHLKEDIPDLKAIILDPIASYMGKIDSYDNAQVRGVLDAVALWASKNNVAVIGINHLNKNTGVRAVYRNMGSVGFTAVARMVWHIIKDLEDKDRRLMLSGKQNIAPEQDGLAYGFQSVKLDEGGIMIDSVVLSYEDKSIAETADEKLEQVISGLSSTRRKVGDWLKKMLEGGPVKASDILKAAEAEGFGDKTLKRVKKQLQIKTKKVTGGGWEWEL